jgi:hypothetical protein
MTVRGKWRIVEMPDYVADYPDMVEPAYILFNGAGGGEFAFGCVTGSLYGAADADAVDFTWHGNDEMDEAFGDGSAELQPDGSLEGEIRFHRGDEIAFTARRWQTSSTAC